MQASDPRQASLDLIFVRHGATAPNLAGVRCGGDLDVPLTETGRRQAAVVAQRIRALGIHVELIVTSDLRRTRETAEIIGRLLPGIELAIEPAFSERRLGAWNMCPLVETEGKFAERVTPPGGESNDEFSGRITAAVKNLLPRFDRRPLLVGSKGVARVLGELLGLADRHAVDNGALLHFDFSAFADPSAGQA
jgi:probable phosphoglycerate mutase